MQNILLETNQADAAQVLYTLEPAHFGYVLSQSRGVTTKYYHIDGLGSTDRLTDLGAAVTDIYVYQSSGTMVFQSGNTINSFLYVGTLGYYGDSDTSLSYIRQRYYHSQVGRFLSQDALTLLPNVNRYQYADNNTLNRFDPSGQLALIPGPFARAGCGFFKWRADFNTQGDGAGFIIQKVLMLLISVDGRTGRRFWTRSCPGEPGADPQGGPPVANPDARLLEYWELWFVDAQGRLFAGADERYQPTEGDWFASSEIGRGRFTVGTFFERGDLFWDPGVRVQRPPRGEVRHRPTGGWDIWGVGRLSMAGNLASTCLPPRGLTDVGHGRLIFYHWNCCDGHGPEQDLIFRLAW